MLVAEAIFLASQKCLFHKLSLYNDDGKPVSENSAISTAIKQAFAELSSSNDSNLKIVIDVFLTSTEKSLSGLLSNIGISDTSVDILKKYAIEKFSHVQNTTLGNSLCCLIIKILCLKECDLTGTTYYSTTYGVPRIVQSLSLESFSYESFFTDLENRGCLLSFIIGNGDYCDYNLTKFPYFIPMDDKFISMIESILTKQDDKNKFEQWCSSTSIKNSDLQTTVPIPELEVTHDNISFNDEFDK